MPPADRKVAPYTPAAVAVGPTLLCPVGIGNRTDLKDFYCALLCPGLCCSCTCHFRRIRCVHVRWYGPRTFEDSGIHIHRFRLCMIIIFLCSAQLLCAPRDLRTTSNDTISSEIASKTPVEMVTTEWISRQATIGPDPRERVERP